MLRPFQSQSLAEFPLTDGPRVMVIPLSPTEGPPGPFPKPAPTRPWCRATYVTHLPKTTR